ncbi:MAG TPA: hypothetical protein DDZ66_14765 [Firmicutes bacterium]|jgi:Na+(H+)/acetate symporter ActP|nr:hypothetical protein [Bacillota bacterium]
MVILIIFGYVVVGGVELLLWKERPWQKVLVYLLLLSAAATFSVLLAIDVRLPVPEPLGTLRNWLQKLWQ